jgi:periplasmic iron binding protein
MVPERWRGLIVLAVILGGVATILVLNVSPKRPASSDAVAAPGSAAAVVRRPAGFREYPIGEDVEINQLSVVAVWLPPVQMDGSAAVPPGRATMIHLEADIHATKGNRNGFAEGEFVPYLTVRYTIVPADAPAASKAVETLSGTMMPMVARDGWHYGANVEMPKAGRYTLTYHIDPPSAGGLAGRHSDPVTGVDPWWEPFDARFDWDFAGPPALQREYP